MWLYISFYYVKDDFDGLMQKRRSSIANALEIYLFALNHFDGLVQDCWSSNANTQELLQSCAKPSIWSFHCKVSFGLP